MVNKFFYKRKSLFLFIYTFLLTFVLFSQSTFPIIPLLESKDEVFKQFIEDVENGYLLTKINKTPIMFYTYNAIKGDTLLTIAARCLLPYETIALLNSINTPSINLEGKKIVLPTRDGLFIQEKGLSALHTLLRERYFDISSYLCYDINGVVFYFIPKGRLTPTERAFFLDSRMCSPLPDSVLTSDYGKRISPITGNVSFHHGIDLAAPEGTPVLACFNGKVEQCGYDTVYGNKIVLLHDTGMKSIYAHLKKINTQVDDVISTGEIIGYVGTTGKSTGPHLHFEVQINGKDYNPQDIIK